jgi:lipopolysaccharide/colanic/teichoic acid biosynthesis glycosyltransferase
VKAVPVPPLGTVAASERVTEFLYRVFEILVAVLGLVLGLSVILLEAVLIRLDSPGRAVL